MEEQKKKTISIAKKEEGQSSEMKKPSYEELNNYCIQLYNQNKQLIAQVKEMNATNLFKRLDYLFLVIQNKEAFKAETDFYNSCIEEIKGALVVDNTQEEADKK